MKRMISTPPRLNVLVPAYFYPGGPGLREWDALFRAAERVPITAIVNPASGPGDKSDANYVRVIRRASGAGITLIGYVDTNYAARPLAEVKADVDRWRRLYPTVGGIFFDQQASAEEKADYYAALYAHVRRRRGPAPVVSNPGTVCAEEYVSRPAVNTVCLFENKTGFEGFRPPLWTRRYGADRFAALAYAVSDAGRMRTYLRKAVRDRIGYVYVTDAGGVNPWDRLPRYWSEEITCVEEINGKGRRNSGGRK